MAIIRAKAITLKEANEFVLKYHRHHKPVRGDKFRVAAVVNGETAGVVQVGRPVARALDDGLTVEIVRLCVKPNQKNVCSFLIARACQAAKALGYSKIITYILDSEAGGSLKAAGWQFGKEIRGHKWDCPSRPRNTTAPTCNKKRYFKTLEQ